MGLLKDAGSHTVHIEDYIRSRRWHQKFNQTVFFDLESRVGGTGIRERFGAFLLDFLEDEDFQDAEGSWVRKATDVGMIYRFLEVSGPMHICRLTSTLYWYRTSSASCFIGCGFESDQVKLFGSFS